MRPEGGEMVELYRFNKEKDRWLFVRYGHAIFHQLYASNGYLVVHLRTNYWR